MEFQTYYCTLQLPICVLHTQFWYVAPYVEFCDKTRVMWLMDTSFIWLMFNTLRQRKNARHFADNTFKRIFFNENVRISIKISLEFVPNGPINNIRALVQIMTRRRPGNKPVSEHMMISLPMYICVSRPQWLKYVSGKDILDCNSPMGL